jgi:sugar phosphate isomerase/epimerase
MFPLTTRRSFLAAGAALALSPRLFAQPAKAKPADRPSPTKFQIACMTLPYAPYPFERALSGIKEAGYKYVALYTTHKEADGKQTPVIAADDAPDKAKDVGKRCRDMGLEPVLMFSGVYPEAANGLDVLKSRIKQAAAAGVPQILTFGHTKGDARKLWLERFKILGPIARDHKVLIVVKQHGGETGTGAVCAEITREVNDAGIKVNYDAGNVNDYLNLDPIPDIKKCADEVRSFCIKDHRRFRDKSEDCGPGLGDIDHYKLLDPVAFTGLTMPLCCENIFAPLLPRPTKPEGVDALARRAREFLELVIAGLQA